MLRKWWTRTHLRRTNIGGKEGKGRIPSTLSPTPSLFYSTAQHRDLLFTWPHEELK
jgi:hypothetical protein